MSKRISKGFGAMIVTRSLTEPLNGEDPSPLQEIAVWLEARAPKGMRELRAGREIRAGRAGRSG